MLIKSNYLSKENSMCIKGIFAILILLHHLYQYSGLFRSGYLIYVGYCFQALGFFATAMFFFLSGYGMACLRGGNSLKGFVKNKIIPFYIVIILSTIFYFVFRVFLLNERFTVKQIISSLTFGGTIVKNGWYLQVQLLYYIVFYLIYKLFNDRKGIIALLCFNVIFIAFCVFCKYSSLFYERTFIFFLGVVWGDKKEKIDTILENRKKCVATLLISLILFSSFYIMTDFFNSGAIIIMFRMISYPFFIVFAILFLREIKINCAINRFLGKISLEIYVFQGAVIALTKDVLNISNQYLFVIFGFIGSICLAFVIHPLTKLIYNLFRKNNKLI